MILGNYGTSSTDYYSEVSGKLWPEPQYMKPPETTVDISGMRINSQASSKAQVVLPPFSHTRVMMMPVLLEDLFSLPRELMHYVNVFSAMVKVAPVQKGVGYLTIDEKVVQRGKTHRRAGLHVDGVYKGASGGWGGGTGPWGGKGFLTVASHMASRAYLQEFVGEVGPEGECEHLRSQIQPGGACSMLASFIYWLDPMCVHESLKVDNTVYRQFVRLSMPSDGPWFEGYTPNPKGVKPTGPILPRRDFMDQ